MTLTEIYNAIMTIDATCKRVEANQIESFQRMGARVLAIEDTMKALHAQVDSHSKQIADLRKHRHDLNGQLAPMFMIFSEEHPDLVAVKDEDIG